MSTPTFEKITAWLDACDIQYRHVHHEPTPTSEAVAAARGENLSIGGKALLMKVGKEFTLFVLSAALKIDSPAIKRAFGARKLRFATADELMAQTGLVPGSVPPFGQPILPFDLYLVESVTRNEKIAFNAGARTDSLVMQVEDYLRVAGATVMRFAQEK